MANEKDELMIGGHAFTSRFILGSGKYSYDLIDSAINNLITPRPKSSRWPCAVTRPARKIS